MPPAWTSPRPATRCASSSTSAGSSSAATPSCSAQPSPAARSPATPPPTRPPPASSNRSSGEASAPATSTPRPPPPGSPSLSSASSAPPPSKSPPGASPPAMRLPWPWTARCDCAVPRLPRCRPARGRTPPSAAGGGPQRWRRGCGLLADQQLVPGGLPLARHKFTEHTFLTKGPHGGAASPDVRLATHLRHTCAEVSQKRGDQVPDLVQVPSGPLDRQAPLAAQALVTRIC